jgi:serine/threonine-protein kinase
MEYVPGQDLKSVIRAEAPLAPERAVKIGGMLARAVGAAHAVGLVHRDIKPQNVLVGTDGRMKVADFGIARAVAAVGNTAPGIVLGTVHYLSPEQATGGAATYASDVYALGVVIYEMLAGRVPFEADSAVGVAMKIAHEVPESLRQLNTTVPAGLVTIVDRAMAHDAAARYPDARALAEALDGYARWSDQATMGLAPARAAVPVAGAAVAVGGSPGGAKVAASAVQPTRKGPLLDWTGLALGLVALAAVAGLVPLWMAVALQSSAAPGSAPPVDGTAVPTATATAAPEALSLAGDMTASGPVTVPDVVNLPAAKAIELLESQQLGHSQEFIATASVAAGNVVSQSLKAGQAVAAGTVVLLAVSGRPIVTVPEVSGDYSTVSAQLERVGLVPRRVERWGGSSTAVDTVIGMDPAPGMPVEQGSAIDVRVNSGSWLPLGVDFADHIQLAGVAVDRDSFRPGEQVDVTARWEAVDTVTGEYLARWLILDAAGQSIVAVEDAPGGDRATNSWQTAEVFAGDQVALMLPPDAALGVYAIALELVNRADTGQRLDVVKSAYAESSGPRVVILPIRVRAP